MSDVIQKVLTTAGLAFGRLASVKAPPQAVEFFRKLGFEIPQASFGPALPALAAQANGLSAAVGSLVAADGIAIVTESLPRLA